MSDAGFVLDPSYRRPGNGAVVVAGSPLRLFRLGVAGVRIVEAIERGTTLPDGHERLTARLLDAGAIHPVPTAAPIDPADLTVVVPAFGAPPRWSPGRCRTIVVDDASALPIELPIELPIDWHAPGPAHHIIRLDRNGGPGAARNAGLAEVTTTYVAFVDSDVDVDESTLLALAGQLAAWDVALLAPRVLSSTDANRSLLAAYERGHSPLDLGPLPGRVAATTRISYVPAATIVCRTDAVRAVGGFDESLRFGEDVDLVWRLHERGERCRYEPSFTVGHQTRPGWRAWLAQRFHYGTSAAPLAMRHRGALAPVRMSGWSAGTWGLVAAGHPLAGASMGVGTTLALVRKLRDVPSRESVRLAGLGHLYAGRLLAATIVRAWWPITVALALVSRRARLVLVASVAVSVATEAPAHRGRLDPVRAGLLRLADDAGYGAGVWAGMWRARSLDAIAPSLRSWPGRADASSRPT